MVKKFLKNENGISMVTLITTIILLLIISTVVIYNSRTSVHLEKLNQMYADLQTLQDKVDIYYIENGKLPISDNPNDTITVSEGETIFGIEPTENDGEIYYKIDSNLLGNIDLNYDTTYYVNEQSHIVYSSDGINIDGNEYHRINQDYENIYQDVNPETTFTVTFVYRDKTKITATIQDIKANTKLYLRDSNVDQNINEEIKNNVKEINKNRDISSKGWSLNPNDIGDILNEITVTGDITLYECGYKVYDIVYELMADNALNHPDNPSTYSSKDAAITLLDPSRDNYIFGGWFKEEELKNKITQINPQIAYELDSNKDGDSHQIHIYAWWREIVAKINRNGQDIYFPTLQDAINGANNGEEIVILTNFTESDVTNDKSITINLNGFTMTSNIGTSITNTGVLQILGKGKITNEFGTCIVNSGTLTIGNSSDSIDFENPQIYGKNVGIENTATLHYYDGKVSGKTAILGEVTSTPTFYSVVGERNGEITTVWLEVIDNRYVARIDYFYYTSLQSAIDECEIQENNTTQTTIYILRDITLTSKVTVKEGQNIRIDLRGYTITSSIEDYIFENYGELEIGDTSTGGTISGLAIVENLSEKVVKLTGGNFFSNGYLVNNVSTGEIEINGATITSDNTALNNESTGSILMISGTVNAGQSGINNVEGSLIIYSGEINSEFYGIYNNSGEVTIEGGTIRVEQNKTNVNVNGIYGIYNKQGTIKINSGNINVNSTTNKRPYGIYNENGILEMKDGSINSNSTSSTSYTSYGIYNISEKMMLISGGTINSKVDGESMSSYGIYTKGEVKITGGVIDSSSTKSLNVFCYGINNAGILEIDNVLINVNSNYTSGGTGISNAKDATLKVYDGEINSNYRGISNSGKLEILGGNINGKRVGIGNYNAGEVIVKDGNITTISNSTVTYGIENAGTGMIEILGGKISSTSSLTTSYSYGIYNSSTGTVILGEKGDGHVSVETPYITVNSTNNYGFFNLTGEIYFYDGILFCNDIEGITEIEDNYQIAVDKIDNLNCFYLEEKSIDNIVKIESTNKEYSSIQEAINDIEESDTIVVLKDFLLQESIVFDANKNITLDLNGKNITNKYWKITNESNLWITDNYDKNGIIEVDTRRGIYNQNNGNISFISGTIKINQKNYSGTQYGIYNLGTGNVEINGGIISNGHIGIYNSNTGTVRLRNGAITTSSYGIYNSNRKC